jgi:hypothetical protein
MVKGPDAAGPGGANDSLNSRAPAEATAGGGGDGEEGADLATSLRDGETRNVKTMKSATLLAANMDG